MVKSKKTTTKDVAEFMYAEYVKNGNRLDQRPIAVTIATKYGSEFASQSSERGATIAPKVLAAFNKKANGTIEYDPRLKSWQPKTSAAKKAAAKPTKAAKKKPKK